MRHLYILFLLCCACCLLAAESLRFDIRKWRQVNEKSPVAASLKNGVLLLKDDSGKPGRSGLFFQNYLKGKVLKEQIGKEIIFSASVRVKEGNPASGIGVSVLIRRKNGKILERSGHVWFEISQTQFTRCSVSTRIPEDAVQVSLRLDCSRSLYRSSVAEFKDLKLTIRPFSPEQPGWNTAASPVIRYGGKALPWRWRIVGDGEVFINQKELTARKSSRKKNELHIAWGDANSLWFPLVGDPSLAHLRFATGVANTPFTVNCIASL